MDKIIADYSQQYRKELFDSVVPFWIQHSPDTEYGGYYTCLDRRGQVYDTDKFMWLQGRQVWLFSMLYNKVEKRQEWLDLAIHGAEFMRKYGRDEHGNWYFSLARNGDPLVQPYSIFTDCFAAMAFAQLNLATGTDEYGQIAVQTFQNILRRRENPKGPFSKGYPGTRPGKILSLPMIISNLVFELEHLIEPETIEETVRYCVHEVTQQFFHAETGLILELTNPDGSFQDSFEGRLIMPGHSLESMWFLMDIGERNLDNALIKWAVDRSLQILGYGWDNKFDGLFYMLDIKGNPTQQLEWDQKLWWVHQEAILAMLKGYLHTKDLRCWHWFQRLHNYTWSNFRDPEFGEWFGYLNRMGDVLLPLKGGKWKGCFHTPRFLYQGWRAFEVINSEQNKK